MFTGVLTGSTYRTDASTLPRKWEPSRGSCGKHLRASPSIFGNSSYTQIFRRRQMRLSSKTASATPATVHFGPENSRVPQILQKTRRAPPTGVFEQCAVNRQRVLIAKRAGKDGYPTPSGSCGMADAYMYRPRPRPLNRTAHTGIRLSLIICLRCSSKSRRPPEISKTRRLEHAQSSAASHATVAASSSTSTSAPSSPLAR